MASKRRQRQQQRQRHAAAQQQSRCRQIDMQKQIDTRIYSPIGKLANCFQQKYGTQTRAPNNYTSSGSGSNNQDVGGLTCKSTRIYSPIGKLANCFQQKYGTQTRASMFGLTNTDCDQPSKYSNLIGSPQRLSTRCQQQFKVQHLSFSTNNRDSEVKQ